MKAKLFIQSENILGEGPVWDNARNRLLWVDIEDKLICFCDVRTGDISKIEMNSRISSLALTTQPNLYLLALQSGLKLYDSTNQKLTEIANPEKHLPENRFNDGKCDPAGRYWVGSMHKDAHFGEGSLYCLNEMGEVGQKINKLSIPNGLAWSLDGKYLFFIDTADYSVRRYDYNILSGTIDNIRKVIDVPENQGAPDGMSIDIEGMLWIAHWGGANVSRWNPKTGELICRIDVPALHVTSCCFGGHNLDTLYITTARKALNEEELTRYPLSGSVFHCKPGVKGFLPNKYQLLNYGSAPLNSGN